MECESCGLIMTSSEEHGAKNLSNPYCKHCTHEDGSLKDRQFVRNGWFMHLLNEGIPRHEAESLVDKQMALLPAWK